MNPPYPYKRDGMSKDVNLVKMRKEEVYGQVHG